MDRRELYRTTGPTTWAGPPRAFSFSSLKRMDTCLRQWQLGRSKYGDLGGYPERPAEPAEVGRIVHDLLSRLFQAAALAGYPPLDSDAFKAVVRTVDITGTARRSLEAFARDAAVSPRARGFQLQTTARDVYNKVAAAFRDEYERAVERARTLPAIPTLPTSPSGSEVTGGPERPGVDRYAALERLGVLSEEEVRHPRLPLRGFVDLLVRRDGATTIIDFKTGKSQPEYQQQLFLYALMWWRSTGDRPARIELRFGALVEGWPVSEGDLVRVEQETEARIARYQGWLSVQPAAVTVGAHCERCHVRQLCGDYWAAGAASGRSAGSYHDREIVVRGAISKTGFVGEHERDGEITFVFDEDVGLAWGPFTAGERLRILGASQEPDPGVLRLGRASEVFRSSEP